MVSRKKKYVVCYDGTYSTIEEAREGEDEGTSFQEAKRTLLQWLTTTRDDYAEAVKSIRKLRKGHL